MVSTYDPFQVEQPETTFTRLHENLPKKTRILLFPHTTAKSCHFACLAMNEVLCRGNARLKPCNPAPRHQGNEPVRNPPNRRIY